jgi:hypothetical protein
MMIAGAAACSLAGTAKLTEVQRVRSGPLEVVLLSPHEALQHGKNTFTIEFRSISNGTLADVGAVRATASMPMGGTPMLGSIEVQRTSVAGRYTAASDLGMAGTWRMTIEWNGPAGRGSVSFAGSVQ